MNENFTPEFSLDSKLQTTKNEDVEKMNSGPSEWVIRNILSYSASLLIVKSSTGDVMSMVMN
jgi:hypothetical protein